MGNLNEFFRDLGRNAYGLGENVASLGSAAIAEPVAGFAAMYDPANGAQAIREGMTYAPRTQAGQMYQQGAARTLGAIAQPAMPVIDTWQRGVDIAGGYSPVAGAMLRTVPAAIGVAMGAKPALQAGRQVSNSLGAMQARMVANANAPSTLNTGFRGQRGAIGLTNDFDNSDEIKIIADYLGQSPESMLVNRDLYTKKQGAINSLVSRYEQMDDFSGAYYPTSYGYISISPSAKSNGQWQLTSFDKKMNPLSDQGEMSKNKALTEFFKTIKPNKYGNITPVQTTPKRPLTEFEQAHLLAQQRAALPVNQRGLGLAPDNTAMDRARAMGFDVDNPVYHGTREDISSFDPSRFGQATGAKSAKGGVFTASETERAGMYADNAKPRGFNDAIKIYQANRKKLPILEKKLTTRLINSDNSWIRGSEQFLRLQDKFKDVKSKREMIELANEINRIKKEQELFADTYKPDAITWHLESGRQSYNGENILPLVVNKEGYKTLDYNGKRDYVGVLADDIAKAKTESHNGLIVKNIPDPDLGVNTVSFNPNQLRSRFAAFDPFNRDSSNLLAQSAKFAPAATLGALMANEKRKDKRN